MSVILSLDNVSKYFTSEPTLDRVTFDIRASEHVALIGPNGAGKTTLLKILMGELDCDRGSVNLVKNANLGVLKQRHVLPPKQTVIESARVAMQPVLDLIDRANDLAQKLADAMSDQERTTLGGQYDKLQVEINQRDGYQIDRKIERVLDGLGFSNSDFEKDVNQLSGGQLNRLMLARLLLEEPTLMLLDEPSNHLDIAATEWLEDFLIQSRQAFLLVSHDRYFLDRVSDQTLELVNAKIDKYPGNYSKYKILKQQRLEVERSTYEKQQTVIEKLKDFIRRNHHGLKHAQAEDRRKKLERIKLVELPREIQTPTMKFAQATRTGDIVLRCQELEKGFDGQTLFADVNFQIERGERWGIIGANGCGKSTLLKCLLDKEKPHCGQVKIGEGVDIGYFDQHLSGVRD
ncbi:MAG: ABC-F family ATP-binding cassette domain-containing protein, partial [Planctomycetota bacterium]